MLRFLAVFVVLFAGAAAALALLPKPTQVAASRAPTVEAPQASTPVDSVRSDIRVVYPAPSSSVMSAAAQPARVMAMAQPPVLVTSAPVASPIGPVAATDPGVVPPLHDPALPEAVTPTDDAARTASLNLDLNTASIEALNEIPGAGHIGRSIASHRPYRSVEELLTKRVVRKSVYDRIKDQVAAQ